jgi:hypothetical protein
MPIDNSTWDFLVTEYGEAGAREATAEIEFWQDNGRLPKWAMFIQQIITETDGTLTFVHRDNRANDSASAPQAGERGEG